MTKFHPSDDGKVIDGKIVVFLHPAGGDDSDEEGAGPAADGAATQDNADNRSGLEPASATAKGETVCNLRWGSKSPADGDEVEMLADAPDGSTVIFTLERRAVGVGWQSMGSVKSVASSGTARATSRVEHPGGLDDAHYRFRARLL